MRSSRLLPLVLGAALAVVLARFLSHGAPTVRAEPAASSEQAAQAHRAADLTLFRAELESFRAGAARDGGIELDACARRLADAGRGDVLDVLAYYRALTPEDLRRGLELDRRFEHAWSRVNSARGAELDRAEWHDERTFVLHDLDLLIEEGRAAADDVPAARALGLRARLAIEEAENALDLADDAREARRQAARDDAEEARSMFARAGFLTPQLEPLWVLGRAARLQGDLLEAKQFFGRCLAIARRVANTDFERHALQAQLRSAREDGDVTRGEQLVDELARIDDVARNWSLVHEKSELLLARDEAERSIELLASHPPLDERDRPEWNLERVAALTRAKRFDAARQLLDDADEWPEGLQSYSLARRLADAMIDLRMGDAASARTKAASVLADANASEKERVQAGWVDGESNLALGDAVSAIAVLRATLGDGEVRQSRRMRVDREPHGVDTAAGDAAGDPEPARGPAGGSERADVPNVIGEQVGLHAVALLAEAYLRIGDARGAALAIERHQGHMLRAELDDAPDRAQLESADLDTWAGTYEAGLVTWVVGADASVVVHVARDGSAVGALVPRGRRSIQSAARRLREACIAGDETRTDEIAAEIQREILPAPISERLERSSGRLLCVVHGPIEGLALERLPLFASGTLAPLCLPSLSTARPGEPPPRSSYASWNLLGAPIDAAHRELLPGARVELEALHALHPADPLRIGAAFDRAALEQALRDARPLHIATHVVHGDEFASGRFLDVGLELSNGDSASALEIDEVRPALPLAFLAACETGGGRFIDAQGLQGIALAFLESGTRNLLVTSWPVADSAAREFALAYHAALSAGATPSESAARARAELRKSGCPSAEWSAFRALGRD